MAVGNIVPVPLVEGPAAPARHLHQADPAREDPPVAVTATARELAGFVWTEMTSWGSRCSGSRPPPGRPCFLVVGRHHDRQLHPLSAR